MFGQRNFVNRMSQLQWQGDHSATHQRTQRYQTQRHAHATHQNDHFGVAAYQPTYANHQTYQRTRPNNEIPPRFNNNNKQPLPVESRTSVVSVRAIRGIVPTEDSLFPHGESFAEDYLHEWDQRPECPRPKWEYPENPSWEPPIKSRFEGDYSGTELILANEAIREMHLKSPTSILDSDWLKSLESLLSQVDSGVDCNSDTSSVKSSSSGSSLGSSSPSI